MGEMSKFKKVTGCHVNKWLLYTGKKCVTTPKHKACTQCNQLRHYLCRQEIYLQSLRVRELKRFRISTPRINLPVEKTPGSLGQCGSGRVLSCTSKGGKLDSWSGHILACSSGNRSMVLMLMFLSLLLSLVANFLVAN